jgi:hypothetical protein
MPQFEMLFIGFSHPVANRDVKRQLMHAPITIHVTLPNPCRFVFRGVGAYLKSLVRRITAPSLEKLEIFFYEQLIFFVPRLLQFMNRTEGPEFSRAKFQLFTVMSTFQLTCTPVRTPRCMLFLYVSIAGTLTGRYLPCLKFPIRSAKYSLRWKVSLSSTRYMISHLKNTTRPTALSGANFLGHLAR